jgi:hypothetical protein
MRAFYFSNTQVDNKIKLIFVWLISVMRLPLRSTSRSRAVVARRAHNPKVGSSNLPFATEKSNPGLTFYFPEQLQFNWQGLITSSFLVA